MASRLKKLFSRKKGDRPQYDNGSSSRADDDHPTFRTSLYDSAPAAPPPETGTYPIKGDHTSPVIAGRRGSSRSRRYNSTSKTNMSPPPFMPPTQQQRTSMNPSANPGGLRMVQDESNLSDHLSNLRLNNDPAAARSQAPTSARGPRYGEDVADRNPGGITAADLRDPQYSYMSAVYGENVADRNIADNNNSRNINNNNINNNRAREPSGQYPSSEYMAKRDRALSQGREQMPTDTYRGGRSPDMSAASYASPGRQGQDDVSPVRRRSIPRKQVGSGLSTPTPQQSQNFRGSPGSSPHVRQASLNDKPLPTPPGATNIDQNYGHGANRPAQPSFCGQRMVVEGAHDKPSLEGIVDLSNTKDTMVIETIAPAVTHETVHQNVHHVREEVVTREIHTHDVYHRIQPIIDVEVLPARHFLPVEGGGLVEINAEDVPGRRNNWVIAETASKIASDEAAPAKITRFSAREFPGTEGDAKRYITPQGLEKTEETWVHPPELESGGMLTGQTWPMHFPGSQTATPDIRSTGNNTGSGGNRAQPVGTPSDSRAAPMSQNLGRQGQPLGSRTDRSDIVSANMPGNTANPDQMGSRTVASNLRSGDQSRNAGYQGQPAGSQYDMRSGDMSRNAGYQGQPTGSQNDMPSGDHSRNAGYQGQPAGSPYDMRSWDMSRNAGYQGQPAGSQYDMQPGDMSRNPGYQSQPTGSQSMRSGDMSRNPGYQGQPTGSQNDMRSANIPRDPRSQGQPTGSQYDMRSANIPTDPRSQGQPTGSQYDMQPANMPQVTGGQGRMMGNVQEQGREREMANPRYNQEQGREREMGNSRY